MTSDTTTFPEGHLPDNADDASPPLQELDVASIATSVDQDVLADQDADSAESIAQEATEDTGAHSFPNFASDDDETTRLQYLATTVRNQNDLERAVGEQADEALLQQATERDEKRLEKTQREKAKLEKELNSLRESTHTNPQAAQRAQTDIRVMEERMKSLDNDCGQIKSRIRQRHDDAKASAETAGKGGNARRPGETPREFLIRTGKITPFQRMPDLAKPSENLADVMMDAEQGLEDEDSDAIPESPEYDVSHGALSHRNLARPGFQNVKYGSTLESSSPSHRMQKRRKVSRGHHIAAGKPNEESSSEGEFQPEHDEESDSDGPGFLAQGTDEQLSRATKRARGKQSSERVQTMEEMTDVDDGKESLYRARVTRWETDRRAARERAAGKSGEEGDSTAQNDSLPEHMMPHPTCPDEHFDGGLRVPGDIFPSLFDYQKTGVRWLWELYQQKVGGIVGDEMGLGKTITTVSFMAALHHSGKFEKPAIIVCPATIMKQWVSEIHRWWPPFRVSILHSSGSGMMDLGRESKMDDDLDADQFKGTSSRFGPVSKTAKKIIERVVKEGHLLITTYTGLQTYAAELVSIDWGYAVLDEGHKIRNPNTSVTIYCKELRTSNRIILSGTPIQNNLTELWSLFDFVYPMRLGTLVNFRDTFEIPIKQGGYANASNLQVETAYNCAEALKDTISPYLLQRWKSDVASDLPSKSEQVLFCKLTTQQRSAYHKYLASNEHQSVEKGQRQPLYSIDILRKICNHPDLLHHKYRAKTPGYGAPSKSGKMQVVGALLQLWKDTGHKTLLFAQHRIMLDILEIFVGSMEGVNFRRMDGNTAIKNRQFMVDEFNTDPDVHVFLLTTKVGGIGVNLTGADRVIIFDPDWNPSTDIQARERAWRLGQKRDVMIFRLMSAGTIEEKIYHRQLFKQFLTNKILRDPKQRQTFQLQGLQDLFNLGPADGDKTETGGLFEGTETRIEDQDNGSAKNEEEAKLTLIAGVDHSEKIDSKKDPSIEQPQADNDGEVPNDNQNHFMESLLGRSGVHASLSHDAIVGHDSQKRGKITADPVQTTRDAKRVAAEAAAQLRRAEAVARSTPVGTPTWTGQVGVSGRPQLSSFRGGFGGGRGRGGSVAGPSSSAVMAHLAARQSGQDGAEPQRRGVDFMTRIRDFLKVHGGRVATQMLVDHFKRYCTTRQRNADFKAMLQTLADLESTPTGSAYGFAGRVGRGIWVLKEEFGGPAKEE